jgi:hypothetical protein
VTDPFEPGLLFNHLGLVKQAIAWQRFIPFYNFIGHQDRQFDSPSGGLALHWILTVIQICATDTGTDAYSFNIGLVSYDYEILMCKLPKCQPGRGNIIPSLLFAVFLGFGLFRLTKRMRTIKEHGQWKPAYLKNRVTLYGVALAFISVNMLVLVVTAKPKDSGTIPRFYWPVTMAAVLAAAAIYWGVFKALQMSFGGEKTLGQKIGFEVSVYNEGDEDIPEVMMRLMREAGRDGSRRRVSYKVRSQFSCIFVNPILRSVLTKFLQVIRPHRAVCQELASWDRLGHGEYGVAFEIVASSPQEDIVHICEH